MLIVFDIPVFLNKNRDHHYPVMTSLYFYQVSLEHLFLPKFPGNIFLPIAQKKGCFWHLNELLFKGDGS